MWTYWLQLWWVCACVGVGGEKNNIKEGGPHGSKAPVVT